MDKTVIKERIREARIHQRESIIKHLKYGDPIKALEVARGYKNFITYLCRQLFIQNKTVPKLKGEKKHETFLCGIADDFYNGGKRLRR